LETSNWTVGAALVGWLGSVGLAWDIPAAFAVDPASFIKISLVMDGTVSTERDTFPTSRTQATKKCAPQEGKTGFLQPLLCDRGDVCDDVAMIELMKRCTKSEKMMTNYGIQVP
jgi:hypothetical protein